MSKGTYVVSRPLALAMIALMVVTALVAAFGFTSHAAPSAQAQAVSPTPEVTTAAGPVVWNGQGGISVAGTGTIKVQPDIVKVSLGVQSQANTVSDAQSDAASKAQALTDALKKAGIVDTDIQTNNYAISPNYIYQDGQAPKLNGYTVSQGYSVTIRDLSKAGSILDVAGSAGATTINGIEFSLSDDSAVTKQARAAAMSDAHDKATQLATAGQVTLGSVVQVAEGTNNVSAPVPMAFDSVAAGSNAKTALQPGQYSVTINVQVTYSIK